MLVNLAIMRADLFYRSQTRLCHGFGVSRICSYSLTYWRKSAPNIMDSTNLTYRELTYAALNGMVAKLDPHSEFLDPQAYQQLQDDTEGQFGGLGLVVIAWDWLCHRRPRRWRIRPGPAAAIVSGDQHPSKSGFNSVSRSTPPEDRAIAIERTARRTSGISC